MRAFSWIAVMALALALPLAAQQAQADAVDVAGVKYETEVEIGKQPAHLNGAGIRYKAVFKVYAAALYLGSKSSNPETVLSSNTVKRLHITMLREVDGNELGKLFTKGIEQNATRDEFTKAINGVLRVGEIFSSRKSLTPGEHFSVDYIPGTGSVIQLNGKVIGTPIKEPEFYSAFLRVWLGKTPADDFLKDALLGVQRGRQR